MRGGEKKWWRRGAVAVAQQRFKKVVRAVVAPGQAQARQQKVLEGGREWEVVVAVCVCVA